MNQIFVDGLGSVTVIESTVRLDLVVFSPTEKGPKGQPQPVFCQRLIMSIDSFARMTEKMQETMRTLSQLARSREGQATAQPAAVTMPQAAPEQTEPALEVPPALARKPFP